MEEKENSPTEYKSQSISCSDDDVFQENESLKLRIWSLETQLSNADTNKASLRELLLQSSQQEWNYLESIKKVAEEDVIGAQKVVSYLAQFYG